MFKISTSNVEALHRVVAMLVAAAVVAWSVGAYTTANAANLTHISNTLSDSDVSALSNHTIAFTIPEDSTGVAAGESIVVTFPAGFNMGSVAFGDIDFSINGADQTLAAAPNLTTWGAVVSGQTLTLTSDTGTVAAEDEVVILVGTNAAGGVNQVTNPTAGSYEFYVTAGANDSGRTRVAILDNVTVTATVNTSFEFTVDGLATSTAVNGTSTTGSSTATELPFGVLTAGEIKTLGQVLTVQTNAIHGFVVTVEQDGNLESSTGADIDGFIDGAYTDTPTAWVSPSNDIDDEHTWGHWGVTTEDSDLDDQLGGGSFAGTAFVAASTTPRHIFGHDGPSDGTTADYGTTEVAYQIEISPLQEAGDDYITTLTYIATPTF